MAIWQKLNDIGQKQQDDVNNFFGKIGSGIESFWNNITGKTSKELAEKNFNLQQEQFDYQKLLNDLLMEREDTAYQRAVKDAQAAGLSAQGIAGSASTSLSAGETPQINDYAQDSFNKGLNLINSITQFQNNITQQILSQKRGEAEIRKINAESDSIDRQNQLFDYKFEGEKSIFDMDLRDRTARFNFNKAYNFFDNADDFDKYAILNKANPKQFSDAIMSNKFNNLGLILHLINKISDKLTDGKISSTQDYIDSIGNIINDAKNSINASVNNNEITLPFIDLSHLYDTFPNVKKDEGTTIKNNGTSSKSGKFETKKQYRKRIKDKITKWLESIND